MLTLSSCPAVDDTLSLSLPALLLLPLLPSLVLPACVDGEPVLHQHTT